MENTFEKVGSSRIPNFLHEIAKTKPTYLVPVKKKGCKLLRHFLSDKKDYEFDVRYIDYFANNDIDLNGVRIAVIDDATKFTSMLYKYRAFFEGKGAIVDTYSFVGQDFLKQGVREQYDIKAHIFSFLDEPTYQEYILQQSRTISSDDYFFDIDHVVIRTKLSEERYYALLGCLDRIGEIDYVNDLYTPKNIDKISIFNLNYEGAEQYFRNGVQQGVLQKIRIAYNYQNSVLTIAPLAFPLWDSNSTQKNGIFDNIPFILPYQLNDALTDEGVFFNIVFAFQICLLKYFITSYQDFKEIREFEFLKMDMISFIGEDRASEVFQSCREFIESFNSTNDLIISNKKEILYLNKIYSGKNSKFHTVKAIMDELRNQYEKNIEEVGFLKAEFFLSYEEILERYDGSVNAYKWIDILCDRGVLVTRNRCRNGIFFRGCRSGEGNYDQVENRTSVLLPLAINCCGTLKKKNGRDVYIIGSTCFNKIIANLVYDYPPEEYDFHSLTTKPNDFGPYTVIQNRIDGEIATPLHKINLIVPYCQFFEETKEYYSVSIEDKIISEKIDQLFGMQDAVPYTEITAYFQFLKMFRDKMGTDKSLNELAICREKETYFRYLYYNLDRAYMLIKAAAQNQERGWHKDNNNYLREAGKNLKAAKEKLRYNQQEIYDSLNKMSVSPIFRKTKSRLLGTFEFFDASFTNITLPILKEIEAYEYCLLNLKLYEESFEKRYWKRFIKRYDEIRKKHITTQQLAKYSIYINDDKAEWPDDVYEDFAEKIQTIFDNGITEINALYRGIGKPSEKQYLDKKKRENSVRTINKIKRIIRNNNYEHIILVYYTYHGFKNEDVHNDVNVVESIQEHVANEVGGKLLYGATGGDENGLLIVGSISEAITFALSFLRWISNIGNIDIRFGCALSSEIDKIRNEDNNYIKEIINEAQYAGSVILKGNAFIVCEKSFKELENTSEAERFSKIMIGNQAYYEEKEVSKMSNDFIYDVEQDKLIRIGIMTVLDEEYNAMKAMLSNPRMGIFRGKGAGNKFLLGEIKAAGGECHTVVLARTIADGNNKAAIRAEKLLNRYPNLDVIFMVGIAGGTPLMPDDHSYEEEKEIIEKHVRLGDIVVGDSIIQYDYIKEKINEITMKGNNIPPSAEVLEANQELLSESEAGNQQDLPWNKYILNAVNTILPDYCRPDSKTDVLFDFQGNTIDHPVDNTRNPQYPRVFKGKIASSNTVLKNPEKRNQLKKEQNVFAVEMETSGIADSTWESSKSYFAVRGICDYCDDHKNDKWHKYAALAAAAYTRALIERLQK